MNLSNRLTFSLIFSVVLAAAFALTVAPAMAQTTVTVSATHTPDTASTDTDEEELVVKFTYSRDAWPEPVAADFTVDDTALTETQKFAKVGDDKKNYTITIEDEGSVVDLNLAGWLDVDVATSGAGTTADPIVITITPDSTAGTPGTPFVSTADTAATAMLVVAADYLAPDAFLVISNNETTIDNGNVYPTLPTITPPIVKRAWHTHDGVDDDNATMPDLYALFQVNGGGTLNLSAMYDNDNNTATDMVRFGSFNPNPDGDAATDDGKYETDYGRNQRWLVINEVMWAYDNQHVGTAARTQEQWIEVLNRSTRPFPLEGIVLTTKKNPSGMPADVNAKAETDRLSTFASFTNAWTALKGQHGDSDEADNTNDAVAEFISMHRTKYDDGSNAGHWAAAGDLFLVNYKGTPGKANSFSGIPGIRSAPSAYTPPKDRVIINEVFNSETDGSDWLELRNVSDGEQNIKDWHLTYTHGTREETSIQKFPEIKIPAGEVILIVGKDPSETDLAAGIDITESNAVNQAYGAGPHKYRIIENFKIPEIESGFLMLRSHGDAKFFTGRQHLHDAAGPSRVSYNTLEMAKDTKEKETGFFWKTDAWPINGHSGGAYRKHDAKDASNGNASLDPGANFANGKVWARSGTAHGWRKGGGSHASYMGGIGYDRGVKRNGTPGYHNDVVKGTVTDLTDGGLIISELMLTTDDGRLPQWIELHNTSRTRGINLAADGSDADKSKKDDGWRMIIENHNSGSWAVNNERPLVATINLKDFGDLKYIPPNQTVLIASRVGRNSNAKHFPSHRVASVWGTRAVRDIMKPKNSRDDMLNAEGGFYIKIVDGAGNVSDEIGNLDGKVSRLRAGDKIDGPYSWTWPNETADGRRTSLIRIMDGGTRGVQGGSAGTAGTPRPGVPDRTVAGDMTGMVLPLGTDGNRRGKGKTVGEGDAAITHALNPNFAKAAWVHADDTALADSQESWYGSNDDIGTPLHTTGTPLPVRLSFFRPTLEDGKVVIRWTTESELDNAGFNILRSQDRNGEFTKVNDKLVQGKGTTAERSTYKWVDTSAKPGAVYYYQIEDVSFAGERNTLTTTKLKGLISAKNKLTTRWGELKSQN